MTDDTKSRKPPTPPGTKPTPSNGKHAPGILLTSTPPSEPSWLLETDRAVADLDEEDHNRPSVIVNVDAPQPLRSMPPGRAMRVAHVAGLWSLASAVAAALLTYLLTSYYAATHNLAPHTPERTGTTHVDR